MKIQHQNITLTSLSMETMKIITLITVTNTLAIMDKMMITMVMTMLTTTAQMLMKKITTQPSKGMTDMMTSLTISQPMMMSMRRRPLMTGLNLTGHKTTK